MNYLHIVMSELIYRISYICQMRGGEDSFLIVAGIPFFLQPVTSWRVSRTRLYTLHPTPSSGGLENRPDPSSTLSPPMDPRHEAM